MAWLVTSGARIVYTKAGYGGGGSGYIGANEALPLADCQSIDARSMLWPKVVVVALRSGNLEGSAIGRLGIELKSVAGMRDYRK